MTQVLILLGSKSDLPITEKGLQAFKDLGVSFSLRIASAHRTPDLVHKLVTDHEANGGKAVICVAGMSAHLAGVVAALTTLPVVAVPLANAATAGFDALLSMGQMPAGIPVATMTLGKAGFTNAALFATQMIATADADLMAKFKQDRQSRAALVMEADEMNRVDFEA